MTTSALAEIWANSTGAEFLQAIARGEVPSAPHAADVGLAVRTASPGHVELSWLPVPRLMNPAGIVHGGYIAMVLDDAAGLSCVSLGDRFRPMLTLDLRIDFLRQVSAGTAYRAFGEVVHAGKARTLADARIVGPDGKLIARASGAFLPNMAFDPTRDPRTA